MTTLQEEVQRYPWYHVIDLNGVKTPGIHDPEPHLKRYGIPDDLTGKTVLDVGAWDGYFSFLAEKRGAKRVLATDSFAWSGKGWGRKDGFQLARRILQSKVEDFEIDVMELDESRMGTFDVVLFLGVLYHLRHPLLALERVFSVTGDQLILDTQVDLLGFHRPAMVFYPGTELNKDPTNWWGPNPEAVVMMLKDVGFKRVKVHSPPWYSHSFPWRLGRALLRGISSEQKMMSVFRQGRAVFHAWRS